MSQSEKNLTEKESLDLITQMINKAKESYYDTGVSAIMWGALIAFCSLEKLAELQFNYHLPFDIFLLTLAAIIPQIFISKKENRERKVRSYDDVYMNYIWLAFGICIFLMIFIANFIFNAWEPLANDYQNLTGKNPLRFNEYTASLFLLLYGIPAFITGAACKFRPMLWGGLICWVCCIISLFTEIKIDLLLTAFSAVFAWFIPGILMEKDYRKAKKELAKANV